MPKYIITKHEVNHLSECRVIVHDNYYWHENIAKDMKVYSSGFFDILLDPYDRYGFKVICGGSSQSLKEQSKEGDENMIKAMLLGIKIWEL